MDDQILDEFGGDGQRPEFASFGSRVGASLVDTLVFMPFILLGFYNLLSLKLYFLDVVMSSIMFAYKPFMEWRYKATFGKMVLKLEVVNENYQQIELSQSLIRYSFYAIGYLISFVSNYYVFHAEGFFEVTDWMDFASFQEEEVGSLIAFSQTGSVFLLISVLLVLFDQQSQALHDKMAKTFCVYR
ncbi:MAG: RDD family protein [Bacteroidota bacterium]